MAMDLLDLLELPTLLWAESLMSIDRYQLACSTYFGRTFTSFEEKIIKTILTRGSRTVY
jgi:hypothetical protein